MDWAIFPYNFLVYLIIIIIIDIPPQGVTLSPVFDTTEPSATPLMGHTGCLAKSLREAESDHNHSISSKQTFQIKVFTGRAMNTREQEREEQVIQALGKE